MTALLHALWMEAPGAAQFAVRSAWESLVIGLFLAALLRTYKGFPPRVCFRLWSAGFLLSALMPFLHWRQGMKALDAGAAARSVSGTAISHMALFSLGSGWAVVLCLAWAVLAATATARLIGGVVSLAGLVHRAAPATVPVQALYRRVAGSSRRAAGALVLESGEVSAPSACGLPRPAILLPLGLAATLAPHELACILRHEAAHLERRDDLWSLLTRLTRAALPLCLAMPYLERGMARAREMVCDDAALTCGVSRPGYAACLARLAEHSAGNGLRGLAPGLSGEGSQLVQRVRHILENVQPSGDMQPTTLFARLRAAAGGAIAVLLFAGLFAGMTSAPGLLAFHGPAQTAARVANPAPRLTPALTMRPVTSTVPLVHLRTESLHAAALTPAATVPEPARVEVASAAAAPAITTAATTPGRAGVFHVETASATRTAGRPGVMTERPAIAIHAEVAEPSVYLFWRRPGAAAPAGVLLVVPGTGSMPSRIFLLTI